MTERNIYAKKSSPRSGVAGPFVSKAVRVVFFHEIFERRHLVPISGPPSVTPLGKPISRASVFANEGVVGSHSNGAQANGKQNCDSDQE